MSWPTFPLDQLGTVSRGRSRHRPRDAEHLYGGPFPFVQTGDVKKAPLYLKQYSQTYSEAGLAQSKLWPVGTLCITIAANIAETAILDIEACFPDSIIGFIADTEKANTKFIKYQFDALLSGQMRTISQGAAQDNLSQAKLLSFEFSAPDLPTQERIAAILSAYDDLIENNRRRIALLEQAARMLYREWFVHFRFPGHETAKFVDGLPEGWEKRRLAELTTKLGSGATPRGGAGAYQDQGLTLIRSLNIYNYSFRDDGLVFINEDQARKLASVTVAKNDVLLNITGASVARCCIVPDRHLPARVNQHVMIVRADLDECSPFFVLHSINAQQNKEKLLSVARAGGATREALTKDVVGNFPILCPSKELIVAFGNQVERMHEQSEILATSNAQLTKARDLLLPRLMDGRIPVEV
jgi:type I restriction enzyme, S subunit